MLDLDALADVFEAPRSGPPPPPSNFEGNPPTAPDWIGARAERAAILEADGGLVRPQADARAAALHTERRMTRPDWHGYTACELQAAAGEDWPEVATRADALAALALLLRTQAQRDRGEIPEHYTSVALCRTCGPVWLFEGEPGPVVACPWCLATKPGAPVPRPILEPQA
jgi:hypothetical protein